MQATTNRILIDRKKLLAMIPLSERTISNMEQRGEFPRRIPLTSRNVAWDLAEVEEWIEARKSSGTHAMRPGISSMARGHSKKASGKEGYGPGAIFAEVFMGLRDGETEGSDLIQRQAPDGGQGRAPERTRREPR